MVSTTPTSHDLDVMALTVWAESRGETPAGQRAVAWVIKHRWLNPRWWCREKGDGIPDDTIEATCRDPWQFSCWNPSDKQSAKLHDPDTLALPQVQGIRAVCEAVLAEPVESAPHTCDHYCTTKVARHTRWARGRKPALVVGAHSFYRICI